MAGGRCRGRCSEANRECGLSHGAQSSECGEDRGGGGPESRWQECSVGSQ